MKLRESRLINYFFFPIIFLLTLSLRVSSAASAWTDSELPAAKKSFCRRMFERLGYPSRPTPSYQQNLPVKRERDLVRYRIEQLSKTSTPVLLTGFSFGHDFSSDIIPQLEEHRKIFEEWLSVGRLLSKLLSEDPPLDFIARLDARIELLNEAMLRLYKDSKESLADSTDEKVRRFVLEEQRILERLQGEALEIKNNIDVLFDRAIEPGFSHEGRMQKKKFRTIYAESVKEFYEGLIQTHRILPRNAELSDSEIGDNQADVIQSKLDHLLELTRLTQNFSRRLNTKELLIEAEHFYDLMNHSRTSQEVPFYHSLVKYFAETALNRIEIAERLGLHYLDFPASDGKQSNGSGRPTVMQLEFDQWERTARSLLSRLGAGPFDIDLTKRP
ncbi:MAG: hypothetical protein JWQ35_233 [Bacteriovoracaceae bacterium]|nr:hypothetical protein [Bacteriovoracaceae bacterium]